MRIKKSNKLFDNEKRNKIIYCLIIQKNIICFLININTESDLTTGT